MRNLHVLSTVILLILVGIFAGYILFNDQSRDSSLGVSREVASPSTANATINTSEKINLTEKSTNLSEENVSHNPPQTKEDYQNLLGKIDYNVAYNLFLTKYQNETYYVYSKINNSADPMSDTLVFLEGSEGIVYATDKSLYGTQDYWAHPNEILLSKRGDGEDFALLAFALLENFKDSNLTCYLIGNKEFTGLFCYTTQYSIRYDQRVVSGYRLEALYFDNWWNDAGQVWWTTERIKIDDKETEQSKKILIRTFISDFLEGGVGYCCTDNWKSKVTAETEDSISFLYNRTNFYELTDRKSFEDFIYNIVK